MIRVYLVDDHEIVRRGLRDLLVVEGDIRIVGGLSSAVQAMEHIPTVRPDVMVLDARLPDGSGVEICREVRSVDPTIKGLILTSFEDDDALLAAIVAGAAGYALKQFRGSDFVLALRRVAAGQSLLDPAIAARMRERLAPDAGLDGLTGDERHVLALIADGHTNPEIAKRAGLSDEVVRSCVSSILGKLGLDRATGITDLGRSLISL
jgi:DNA-binding NarL/FixJ family response regulator